MEASIFQIINKPKLVKLDYSLNDEVDINKQIELELSHVININRYKNNKATVTLSVLFFEEQLENAPFNMHLEIQGIFSWKDELNENQKLLSALLQSNAPAILYSYLRPIVSLITIEGGLPPLTLPLVNFNNNN